MQQYNLNDQLVQTFGALMESRSVFKPVFAFQETGTVISVAAGIAKVSGLPGTGYEELLQFPHNLFGIAIDLHEQEIGAVLLGDSSLLNAGDDVQRTARVMDIPVGNGLLGRVINPVGEPLDDKGPVFFSQRLPVERPAPAIMDRAPVTVPLQTGIMVIDAVIPIGRGQRELVLGDRQTGKTTIAVDTILNQHDKNVICIYCAIGQQPSSIARVIARLSANGAMKYTTVVVTEGSNQPGMKFIAPYAATSIAEYFMEQGRDVLIVYDDLTQHARAYRELSLLLRRPPGREAFPGDIFYIHSRLLERATHLNPEHGNGSLTALPIIETEAQNLAAYIPTNLISITDGQLYLSPRLFELGMLPAVDIGLSVSRVGGKAQLKAYRKVAGNLKLAYAQFEELETFARFGTHLDENTRRIIDHGKRIRACLKQPESELISVMEQIVILLTLTNGLLDTITLSQIPQAETALKQAAAGLSPEIMKHIAANEFSAEDEQAILSLAEKQLEPLKQKTNDHG